MIPKVGCVVLTMGARPKELTRSIESILTQTGVEAHIVVAGNGWKPVDLPAGVQGHWIEQNIGATAGRNEGAKVAKGDYLLFLDDDAQLPTPTTLAQLIATIGPDTNAALVQPRIIDYMGVSERKARVPRLRSGDVNQSGPATSLWEGGVVIRRDVFDEIGGWGAQYFYLHEGIELCWRTWNTGHSVWYAGDIAVAHPPTTPARFGEFAFINGRNRVWLARRNLPIILVPIYPLTWLIITLLRTRSLGALKNWLLGFWAGWTTNPGKRSAMKWSTVWALTKAGRPPII
jgi:GT2 family glycosyltransferase